MGLFDSARWPSQIALVLLPRCYVGLVMFFTRLFRPA